MKKRQKLGVLNKFLRERDISRRFISEFPVVEDSQGRRRDKNFEAELQFEFNTLQYKHVVGVLTAISGYRTGISARKDQEKTRLSHALKTSQTNAEFVKR